jgi:phosphate-selective porin
VRNLEPVVRYDRLEIPSSAPGGGRDQRWTIGLDYWVQPNVVLKIAYQFDDRQIGENLDALMLELGLGL